MTTTVTVPAHAVLTAITGRCTPPADRSSNGFADFHALADVMYPGIGTIGLAYVAKDCARRVAEACLNAPAEWPIATADFLAWADRWCAERGDIELTLPTGVSPSDARL